MTAKELITTLDKILDDAVEKIRKQSGTVQNSVYDDLIEWLASLKQKNGLLSVENISRITEIQKTIEKYLIDAGYVSSVKDFTGEFNSLQDAINLYFQNLALDFADKAAYKEVAKVTISNTINSLTDAGVNANFTDKLRDILRQNIAGQSSLKKTKEQLRLFIKGDDKRLGTLERYIHQVATDSMNQFSSNYMQMVAADLDMDNYLYAGTVISDSRPFCASRAGKYFTRKEVESWGNLSTWDGKVPGTNSSNIFTYRGGYNCRHYLIPVPEEVTK
jgi:hypothetical protein